MRPLSDVNPTEFMGSGFVFGKFDSAAVLDQVRQDYFAQYSTRTHSSNLTVCNFTATTNAVSTCQGSVVFETHECLASLDVAATDYMLR